jgi:hypothetical protein
MNKSIRTIVKLNLKNITAAYIALIAGIGAQASSYITYFVMYSQGEDLTGNENIGVSWAAWALPVAAAIIIPSRHFRRIVSLGGKRENFFTGSLITYAILAAAASLLATVIYFIESRFVEGSLLIEKIIGVPDAFGWNVHAIPVIFLQQFAFLFLTCTFTHAFVSAQGKWYGWASFIGALVVLCVFLPIEPLRNIVIGYAFIILYNPNALLQIIACLLVGLGFYWLNKPIYARKTL